MRPWKTRGRCLENTTTSDHFCGMCVLPKRRMGHPGGYRGYSADVQTDDLEEYWSADLEARLGKTLTRQASKT